MCVCVDLPMIGFEGMMIFRFPYQVDIAVLKTMTVKSD